MNDYYYILSPLSFGASAKKMTYKQMLDYMETHGGEQFFKVKKSDYNSLARSIKGVSVKSPVDFIFNRLHAENKTERA